MTQYAGGYSPPEGGQPGSSTTEVAKGEAADVARTAAQRGGEVAGTVGDQVSRVASETKQQARNLVEEGRGQLTEQARQGQRKAASGLHAVADQLHQMAEKSDGPGVVPEVVRQASERTRGVASWLEGREPGDLVDEVRRFARRRPGVFLAGAAIAGVLAGRLTRGAVAAQSDSAPSGGDNGRHAQPSDADTTRLPSAPPSTLAGTELPAQPPVVPPAGYPSTGAPPQAPGYSMPPAPPVAPGWESPSGPQSGR